MSLVGSDFHRDEKFRIVPAPPTTWVCCYCGKDSSSGVLPEDWNINNWNDGTSRKGYCHECWEKAISIPDNRFGIVVWERLKDGCFKEVSDD